MALSRLNNRMPALACTLLCAGLSLDSVAAGPYDLVLPPSIEIDERVRERVREHLLNQTRARIRADAQTSVEEAIINRIDNSIVDNAAVPLPARPDVTVPVVETAPETEDRARIRPDTDSSIDFDRITERLLETRLSQISLDIDPTLNAIVDREGHAALQNQWLVMTDRETLTELTKAGYEVSNIESLDGLGYIMGTVAAPASFDPADGFPDLHVLDTAAVTVDLNHVYLPQRPVEPSEPYAPELFTPEMFQAAGGASASRNPWQLIGMIDSSINRAHPVFQQARIFEKRFTPSGFNSAKDHGTAIASLLVGQSDEVQGYVPDSRLYNGVIFAADKQGRVFSTTAAIVKALNWMAENQVKLVNMSLAGPNNAILQRAISSACERGMTLVTAAGNAGPGAPPLYPAAYPCTLAITAIDANDQVYHRANRGDYIDFALPGVEILHATATGSYGYSSGTSYAAALMSGLIATRLPEGKLTTGAMRQLLGQLALDRGETGFDRVYGHGVIKTVPVRTALHKTTSTETDSD